MRPDLVISVSLTTRHPRPGEVDGCDYYFTTPEHFRKLIHEEAFLEWAKVHGEYYGTLKETTLEQLERGRDVLLEIDVQGALQVRRQVPDTVMIFMVPPSWEALVERICCRGTESEEQIRRRLAEAEKEIALYTEYDYLIVNDRLEETAGLINAVITAEKCRVKRGAAPPCWEAN